MRLSALVLASALGITASSASASDPCAPPPNRPVHVAAFTTQVPALDSAPVGALSDPAPSSDELAAQAGCLAWERSHARRAEFIGTVPLGSGAALSAIVTPGPRIAVLAVQEPPLPFLSTVIGSAPQENALAPERPRSFSFGVSLIDPR
jgi:hypothetical protein